MSSTNKPLTERYAELQKRESAFERRKAIEPELRKFVEKGNITLAQKSAFSDIFAAIPDDLELSFLDCDGKGVYEFLWYFLNHLKSSGETASFAAAPKKKNCSKGVSCGNACISANKICRKPLTPIQKEEVKEVLAVAPVPAKVEPLKTKPELSDAEKEAISAKVDAAKTKAENAKKSKVDTGDTQGAALKSKLLNMADGADPDSIEISGADVQYAKQKFMDKEGNEYVGNKTEKMKAEASSLSNDEALALSTWIGHNYSDMNAVLYGGKLGKGVDRKAVEITDLIAAKALHKLPPVTQEQIANEAKKKGEPFDSEKPLGRYMTVPKPQEFVKRYQAALASGGEIRESTFFATSHIDRKDFNFCNDDTNLTYEVKPRLDGTGNGRYIDHYKNKASEGEILYPPETRFRVVAVIAPQIVEKSNAKNNQTLTEYKFSPQELQDKDNYHHIIKSQMTAKSNSGEISGKAYQANLAKAYKEKIGKPLPSEEEQAIMKAKSHAADLKKKNYYKDMFEKDGGRNRDRNWIIQLEEI